MTCDVYYYRIRVVLKPDSAIEGPFLKIKEKINLHDDDDNNKRTETFLFLEFFPIHHGYDSDDWKHNSKDEIHI